MPCSESTAGTDARAFSSAAARVVQCNESIKTVEDGTLFFVSISLDQDALAHATRLQELLCNGHHPGVGRIQTVKGKESQEKVKEKQCKVKERQ